MRVIGYGQEFEAKLAILVPDPTGRTEIKKAIEFMIASDPHRPPPGTTISRLPCPIFGAPIRKSSWGPAMVIYYVYTSKTIDFIDVIDVSDDEME